MEYLTDSPTGLLHRDGKAWAGADGEHYLMYLDDDGAALGSDVTVEWDGDAFTLSSPHVGTKVCGDRASMFINRRTGQRAAQMDHLRRLDPLPRRTLLPVIWTS